MNTSISIDRNQISVIIVNYNAGHFLLNSVRSALDQAAEVIVVDNASNDRSIENLENIKSPSKNLKIILNKKNLGFAAACSVGVQQAAEKFILFLNPDCEIKPGSLKRMLDVMIDHPTAGMVGGLLLNPDQTEQGGGRRLIPTPWRSFVRSFGLLRFADRWPRLFHDFYLHQQPLPKNPIEVDAISGALMLVRREAITDVGSWDSGYFLHYEDLDWCLRFSQKGWKVLFVPDAPVIHHLGVCSQERPLFVEWHKHKGVMRFYKKFFSRQYPGPLMGLVAFGVWLRFVIICIRHFIQRMRKSFTKNKIKMNN